MAKSMNPEDICPISATHQKFGEAGYFLSMMVENYHEPWPFLYNFNAFLQANRSVTFMLQKEIANLGNQGLADLYKTWQEKLKLHPLMKSMNDLRVKTVHNDLLRAESTIFIGHFRDRKCKSVFRIDLEMFISSNELLAVHSDYLVDKYLDEEHSAVGEQIGVERSWQLAELEEHDILESCIGAFNIMGELVVEFHEYLDKKMEFEPVQISMEVIRVQLELDRDPTLIDKWRW